MELISKKVSTRLQSAKHSDVELAEDCPEKVFELRPESSPKIRFLKKLRLKEKKVQPFVSLRRLEHNLSSSFIKELRVNGALKVFRLKYRPRPKRKKLNLLKIIDAKVGYEDKNVILNKKDTMTEKRPSTYPDSIRTKLKSNGIRTSILLSTRRNITFKETFPYCKESSNYNKLTKNFAQPSNGIAKANFQSNGLDRSNVNHQKESSPNKSPDEHKIIISVSTANKNIDDTKDESVISYKVSDHSPRKGLNQNDSNNNVKKNSASSNADHKLNKTESDIKNKVVLLNEEHKNDTMSTSTNGRKRIYFEDNRLPANEKYKSRINSLNTTGSNNPEHAHKASNGGIPLKFNGQLKQTAIEAPQKQRVIYTKAKHISTKRSSSFPIDLKLKTNYFNKNSRDEPKEPTDSCDHNTNDEPIKLSTEREESVMQKKETISNNQSLKPQQKTAKLDINMVSTGSGRTNFSNDSNKKRIDNDLKHEDTKIESTEMDTDTSNEKPDFKTKCTENASKVKKEKSKCDGSVGIKTVVSTKVNCSSAQKKEPSEEVTGIPKIILYLKGEGPDKQYRCASNINKTKSSMKKISSISNSKMIKICDDNNELETIFKAGSTHADLESISKRQNQTAVKEENPILPNSEDSEFEERHPLEELLDPSYCSFDSLPELELITESHEIHSSINSTKIAGQNSDPLNERHSILSEDLNEDDANTLDSISMNYKHLGKPTAHVQPYVAEPSLRVSSRKGKGFYDETIPLFMEQEYVESGGGQSLNSCKFFSKQTSHRNSCKDAVNFNHSESLEESGQCSDSLNQCEDRDLEDGEIDSISCGRERVQTDYHLNKTSYNSIVVSDKISLAVKCTESKQRPRSLSIDSALSLFKVRVESSMLKFSMKKSSSLISMDSNTKSYLTYRRDSTQSTQSTDQSTSVSGSTLSEPELLSEDNECSVPLDMENNLHNDDNIIQTPNEQHEVKLQSVRKEKNVTKVKEGKKKFGLNKFKTSRKRLKRIWLNSLQNRETNITELKMKRQLKRKIWIKEALEERKALDSQLRHLNEREKRKRLDQEIPGFNWLEKKIRNASNPSSSPIEPPSSPPLAFKTMTLAKSPTAATDQNNVDEKIHSPSDEIHSQIEKIHNSSDKIRSPSENINIPSEKIQHSLEKIHSSLEKIHTTSVSSELKLPSNADSNQLKPIPDLHPLASPPPKSAAAKTDAATEETSPQFEPHRKTLLPEDKNESPPGKQFGHLQTAVPPLTPTSKALPKTRCSPPRIPQPVHQPSQDKSPEISMPMALEMPATWSPKETANERNQMTNYNDQTSHNSNKSLYWNAHGHHARKLSSENIHGPKDQMPLSTKTSTYATQIHSNHTIENNRNISLRRESNENSRNINSRLESNLSCKDNQKTPDLSASEKMTTIPVASETKIDESRQRKNSNAGLHHAKENTEVVEKDDVFSVQEKASSDQNKNESNVAPKLSILKEAFKIKLSVLHEDGETSTSEGKSTSETTSQQQKHEKSNDESKSIGIDDKSKVDMKITACDDSMNANVTTRVNNTSNPVADVEKPVLISIPDTLPSIESVLSGIKIKESFRMSSPEQDARKQLETPSLIAALYEELLKTRLEVEKLRKIQEQMLSNDFLMDKLRGGKPQTQDTYSDKNEKDHPLVIDITNGEGSNIANNEENNENIKNYPTNKKDLEDKKENSGNSGVKFVYKVNSGSQKRIVNQYNNSEIEDPFNPRKKFKAINDPQSTPNEDNAITIKYDLPNTTVTNESKRTVLPPNSRLRDLLGISNSELDVVPVEENISLQSVLNTPSQHRALGDENKRQELHLHRPVQKVVDKIIKPQGYEVSNIPTHIKESINNLPSLISTSKPEGLHHPDSNLDDHPQEPERIKKLHPESNLDDHPQEPERIKKLHPAIPNPMLRQVPNHMPSGGISSGTPSEHLLLPSARNKIHLETRNCKPTSDTHIVLNTPSWPQIQNHLRAKYGHDRRLYLQKLQEIDNSRIVIQTQYPNKREETHIGSSIGLKQQPQTFQPKIIIHPNESDQTSSLPEWQNQNPSAPENSARPLPLQQQSSHAYGNIVKRPSAFVQSQDPSLRPTNGATAQLAEIFPVQHPNNPSHLIKILPNSQNQSSHFVPSNAEHQETISSINSNNSTRIISPKISQNQNVYSSPSYQKIISQNSVIHNNGTIVQSHVSQHSQPSSIKYSTQIPTRSGGQIPDHIQHHRTIYANEQRRSPHQFQNAPDTFSKRPNLNVNPNYPNASNYREIPKQIIHADRIPPSRISPHLPGSSLQNRMPAPQLSPQHVSTQIRLAQPPPYQISTLPGPNKHAIINHHHHQMHQMHSYQQEELSHQISRHPSPQPNNAHPISPAITSVHVNTSHSHPSSSSHSVVTSMHSLNSNLSGNASSSDPSSQKIQSNSPHANPNSRLTSPPHVFSNASTAIQPGAIPVYSSSSGGHGHLVHASHNNVRKVYCNEKQIQMMQVHPLPSRRESAEYSNQSKAASPNLSGTPPYKKICLNCPQSAQFLCSGCKTAWYCSKECQRQHWTVHSPNCVKRLINVQ